MIWHEIEGAVQPKVDPANMLIQERFLKVSRVEKRVILRLAKTPESAAPNEAKNA